MSKSLLIYSLMFKKMVINMNVRLQNIWHLVCLSVRLSARLSVRLSDSLTV